MTGNDRTLLLIVPVIAAVIAFWFLVLSPRQHEAKRLDEQVTQLRSDVSEQQQAAQEGLLARKLFPRDYHRLVVLGKAVPADDETASLLVQLNGIAAHAGVDFRAITQANDSLGAPSTAPPPAPAGGAESTTSGSPPSSETSTATAAPPTESAAALLPIGATVGSAGLATLPYELTFRGTYPEIADFMAGVDRLVNPRKARIAADGRLVTIDGFTLAADDVFPYPVLKATVQITTYVTPADQGLTVGASPAGPAPASTSTPTTSPPTPTP